MKPTIGRVVIVVGVISNGAANHPALITRVWSDSDTRDGPVAINLTVFPDMSSPKLFSSVLLFDTAEAAQAHVQANQHSVAAYWPPRDSAGAVEAVHDVVPAGTGGAGADVSIPIAEPSQAQIDAKAFAMIRLLDGLAISTIKEVIYRAALFIGATVRLDCAATDFVRAEQGFAGAPA